MSLKKKKNELKIITINISEKYIMIQVIIYYIHVDFLKESFYGGSMQDDGGNIVLYNFFLEKIIKHIGILQKLNCYSGSIKVV